ncbi:MAG: T9SS type A sorting domain-containing protein [Ignavibacteriaceae bacterium]|jgi:hypothetical protein|nr:MAG: T9SS C-terminal target domain-containing protein [Chlorobiota bacterium]KXK02666.1 MAG: 5'-nucleotidase [Chlorobi bacterium OLB4]MBV6398715.1 hypothetical protein [Ignavibacteria bacterium]MCC6885115.1 T9SS type A sorting domain-containing protein [Ignavibacteriales bacterium]MCE7952095.1 T9SS C-terminal target domain-containing protein [Chlorobi bacterium CHB7]MDL1886348.1 T9SS type A sorting domain-containing protein [Ignavibacteria bacterium CHB1]MEB2329381.1 T9SS type A sorting do
MKLVTNILTLVVVFIAFGTIKSNAGDNEHFDNGFGAASTSLNTDDYKLFQNYPNPFNPVTRISYKINKEAFVTLKVFNLVGQELYTLVSENQKPGTYNVHFNGAELTTGIYLYKLQVNDFTSVKRMTLIK